MTYTDAEQKYIDAYIDKYMDEHPTEKIEDFAALEEKAYLEYSDRMVDKMKDSEVDSDLTPEQKKAVKKARGTGTKKATAYKFDTKEKKKDLEKIEILRKIFNFVREFTENCEIANENKEITFIFNGNHYSLNLVKHRTTKK